MHQYLLVEFLIEPPVHSGSERHSVHQYLLLEFLMEPPVHSGSDRDILYTNTYLLSSS